MDAQDLNTFINVAERLKYEILQLIDHRLALTIDRFVALKVQFPVGSWTAQPKAAILRSVWLI